MKNAEFITKTAGFITKNVEFAGEKYFLRKKKCEKNDDPPTKMRFLAYGRRKSPLHRGFLDARAEPHLPTISFASHEPIPEVEIRFEDLPNYPTLHDDLRICTGESYTYRTRLHVLARGIFSASFGMFWSVWCSRAAFFQA